MGWKFAELLGMKIVDRIQDRFCKEVLKFLDARL